MAITQERKAEIIAEYGKDAKDSGSADVQVALLTERIRPRRTITRAAACSSSSASAVASSPTSRTATSWPTVS